MDLQTLLDQVKRQPDTINFQDVIAAIDASYTYTPAHFTNGNTRNEAGTNEGSCKVFAFAKMHALEKNETLALFGEFYFNDVKGHPEGIDHANIRNFMRTGWEGISFSHPPLSKKLA